MVCPRVYKTASDVAIESGIEIQTISVERHEPRNNRIIKAVSPAAMPASRITSSIESDTKID